LAGPAVGKIITGTASGKPISMLWREAKIWRTAHQDLIQQNVKRFSLPQVTAALRHAAAIDRMIKGLTKGDVWDELLQLGLRFARGSAANPTSNRGKMAAARASVAVRNQQALF
jgi:hypothetical protein